MTKTIRCINPGTTYLRAGEVYEASRPAMGNDWRCVSPDRGSSTYLRWYEMRQMLRHGQLVEMGQ